MWGDLGTKPDWITVDHHNTDHPCVRILQPGVTEEGKILNTADDYIAHGISERTSKSVTLDPGRQTEQEVSRPITSRLSSAVAIWLSLHASPASPASAFNRMRAFISLCVGCVPL